MGLCESYSYILEVVERTITLDLADEDDILQYLLSLGWRTQNSYVSILASTGERRGGWPFFDDDLLCLSSKAFSIRPISKERRMDSIVSRMNPASPLP
jgi:hypothetical protein